MAASMKLKLEKLSIYLSYLIAFALGIKQLREPDIWWQILSGDWMLEHGQVTRADVFSYTVQGTPWINVKWLYELLIAVLVKVTGPQGLVLLQGIVNVLVVYFIIHAGKCIAAHFSKNISYQLFAIPVLLFLGTTEYRMASRPEMFSHLFCAVYLYLICRNPQAKWNGLIWFIPLQCLWANMHEGYPVGIVMIGTFAMGGLLSWMITKERSYLQQSLRVLAISGAAVLAIIINPNTTTLWTQPFEIYRQVGANKYTTELYSWTQAEYWTPQAKLHIALLVLAIIYWLAQLKNVVRDKKLNPVFACYLLLIPVMAFLSLTANRNIPFAQIVLYPTVALLCYTTARGMLAVSKVSAEKAGRYSLITISAVIAICYVSVVNNSFYKATGSVNRFGMHANILHNPTGAARFIKENNLQGPAFSDYFVSSYLLWDLYPQFRSFIDLRDLDIFPASFFDRYMDMYANPQKFYTLDSQYRFNYVVLSTTQLVGVQRLLYWQKGYNLVYADPVAAIFLKKNEANKRVNENLAIQKLFTWPEEADEPAWASLLTKVMNPLAVYDEEDERYKPIHAAMFYNQMQNYPLAVKILTPELGMFDGEAIGYGTLANIYQDYADHTPDPAQKSRRQDTANIYFRQAAELQ